jgi:hypothetical protein
MGANVIELNRAPRPYPLPLSAGGIFNDLPAEFEPTHAYARCDVQVRARVVSLYRVAEGAQCTFEIIEGCADVPSLRAGARFTHVFDILSEHTHRSILVNLVHLCEAAGLEPCEMGALTEILGRPFLMSVAVPCDE